MYSPLRAITALLLILFLFGCGQSGPLFIPGDPSTIEPQPAPQEAAEEDDEDDEDASGNP